ncbi:MAG: hypothetical protein JJT78_10145 [Leptospira sp.]|nr:hypothetical protein [Leptospira sp.]
MAVSAYKRILAIALVFASISLFSQETENLEEESVEPTATESATGEPREATEPASTVDRKTGTSSTTSRSATVTTSEATPVGDSNEIFINSNTTFELRATDDSSMVDFIEYRVNNSDLIKYTNPISLSTEGISQITYRSVDKAGNIEAFKLLTVIVDNTPPTVSLLSEEPFYSTEGSSYTSKTNTFSFKAKDELSGVEKVEYAINDSEFQTFSKDNPFRVEKDGTNLIRYTATDNAGNKSREASVAVIIDDKAPKVEILPATPLVDIDGKIYSRKGNTFTVRATDAESGVRRIMVKMSDEKEFRPYVEPIVVNTGGEFTIEAKAIDNVGNESEVVSTSFYVDVNPPQSEIKKIKQEEQ